MIGINPKHVQNLVKHLAMLARETDDRIEDVRAGEQVTEKREAARLVHLLLEELDDDKRAVFILFEIEELPMADVAHVLGCPLQTAYSRRKAALERLRAAMIELEGTP